MNRPPHCFAQGVRSCPAAWSSAMGYPIAAFAVPMIWFVCCRERASFPWVADLLVTLTCFTDTLGNRMDLYDTVVWSDDRMHLMNTGLVTAAVILLTMHRSPSRVLAAGPAGIGGAQFEPHVAPAH